MSTYQNYTDKATNKNENQNVESSVEKSYVGKTYVDNRENKENIDQEKPDQIFHTDLPESTRIVYPDTMLSMDFKPERLNLYVSSENVVTKQKQG